MRRHKGLSKLADRLGDAAAEQLSSTQTEIDGFIVEQNAVVFAS